MFCENCGTKLSDDVKFCRNCGAPVEEDTKREKVPDTEENPLLGDEEMSGSRSKDNHQEGSADDTKPRKMKGVIAVVIILAAIAIAGTLVYFMQNGDHNKSSASSEVSDSKNEVKKQPTTVENKAITIYGLVDWISEDNVNLNKTEKYDKEGLYTGEVVDGIPNGNGRFDAQNSEGREWYYDGEFKDGNFHGQGRMVFEDNGFSYDGTFTNGKFTPSSSELYKMIAQQGFVCFSLSEKSFKYIDENKELFPCKTDSAYDTAWTVLEEGMFDSYEHLEKNISHYQDQLYGIYELEVIQVKECNLYGYDVTSVIAVDYEENVYILYHTMQNDYIRTGSFITMVGLPVSNVSYSNVSGGYTNAIVFVTSLVDVI